MEVYRSLLRDGEMDFMDDGSICRVLCVFSTLDRGGAESMCMNLYRHMDHRKVQFDFVKHTPNKGSFEDEIISLGGHIYEAPRLRGYNYYQYRHWWEKHLNEHPEHHIIHGHFFSISAVYFQIAKGKGRVTVGHIHASTAGSRLKAFLEKGISRYTDYPFACSVEAGRWIYGERQFVVLKNALDIEMFRYSVSVRQKIRKQLGFGQELILGTVANLSSVKNPMGLIDIYISVRKIRHDAKLIWIGEGAQRSAIEDRIRREGIEDAVFLLGTRTDVQNILQAMDVFLLPSFNEGLPVSLIEAQASGLPCYVSDRVTREADITGNCRFLPIDEPEIWAHEILDSSYIREDTSDSIRNAGYDIMTTVKWLQDFYLNIR